MEQHTVFDLIVSSIAAILMIAIVSTPGNGGGPAITVFTVAAVLFTTVAVHSAVTLLRGRNNA